MHQPAGELRAAVSRRLVVYGAGLIVLAIVASALVLLEVQHGRTMRQWQRQIDHAQAANSAAEARSQQILAGAWQNHGQAPTSTDAARLLGTRDTFPDDGQRAFIDQASGGKVFLHFENGRWTSTLPALWTDSLSSRPPADVAYGTISILRRSVCLFVGYPACGLAMLVLIGQWRSINRRSRVLHALDLLAASLFFFVLSLFGPQQLGTWNEFFQDDSGGWGVLGAGLATVLLVVALVRAPVRDSRRCRECNYDLKGNLSGVCPECGTAR